MTYTQDASEKRSYDVAVTGDTISSAVWTVSPTGPTLGGQSNTSTTTQINVSGLVINKRYTLNCHIVGASGQEYDPDCEIVCLK